MLPPILRALLHFLVVATPALRPVAALGIAGGSLGRSGENSTFGRQPMLVVVMIMSAPKELEWRRMVRQSLPELTSSVSIGKRPVQVVTRFAVGTPPASEWGPDVQTLARLRAEAETFGDLVQLDVPDGDSDFFNPRVTGVHHGKPWHAFAWAQRAYPEADLFFKQDDDTIVNWRVALPLLVGSVSPGESLPEAPLHWLYLGRVDYEENGYTCGMGELYGFSSDIVQWVVTRRRPEAGQEDVVACSWVRELERDAQVVHRGLLDWPVHENAWIHPVKSADLYRECLREREVGCQVVFPWKTITVDHVVQRFRIPPT